MELINIKNKKPPIKKDVLLKCESYFTVGHRVVEGINRYKDMQYNYHYPIFWCELPKEKEK